MTGLAEIIEAGSVGPLTMRDKVNAIEAEMRKAPSFGRMRAETDFEQVELPLKHHFSPGVYAREIFIPKGTLVTGRIHKYQQINIMSQGDVSVLTEDGIVRAQAPFTVVSPPGTKRIVYAHEDTVWTTIIGTDETDIDKLEDHLTVRTDEEYAAFLEGGAKIKEISKCPSQP